MRITKWISVFTVMTLCLSCLCVAAAPAYNETLRLRIPGDADGDGKITSTDARLILQRAVEKITDEGLQAAQADVDGDGKITSTDARMALQTAVEKTEKPQPKPLPFKQLNAAPQGEPVTYHTEGPSGKYGGYRWTEDTAAYVFVAQTADEWEYLRTSYGAKTDMNDDPCDIGAYDDAFFEQYALILCDLWTSAPEWDLEIRQLCKNGSALELHLRRFYFDEVQYHGESPVPCRRISVAEIPRSALEGIDTVAVYTRQDEAPAWQ